MCETPPTVPNSNVNEGEQMLSDGSVTSSSVEYICHSGYYIDNESKNNFECTSDGSWSPNELPVCLKGYTSCPLFYDLFTTLLVSRILFGAKTRLLDFSKLLFLQCVTIYQL